MLLAGCQEKHPACKKLSIEVALHLSAARCKLFAYGPTDATPSQNPIISPHLIKHWNHVLGKEWAILRVMLVHGRHSRPYSLGGSRNVASGYQWTAATCYHCDHHCQADGPRSSHSLPPWGDTLPDDSSTLLLVTAASAPEPAVPEPPPPLMPLRYCWMSARSEYSRDGWPRGRIGTSPTSISPSVYTHTYIPITVIALLMILRVN